ncbi:hypothetical protein DRZ78_04010, partial [Candidatus Aerophobetes bacterium]
MKHLVGLVSVVVALFLASSIPALSLEPPRPGELERYQKDGSLARRMEFAKSLQNYKFHPSLVQRKIAKIKALQEDKPFIPQVFPYSTGLPSHGTPRIFAILIDFPDYPHTNEKSIFVNKLFGTGDSAEFPYESLTKYYERSSYGALSIQGDVLGWYTAQHNRDYYGSSDYSGVKELIKEALDYYDPTHDFSQYDNNGDGRIDYFCVFWAGPDTGWSSIWWGWCDMYGTLFGGDSYTIDGKQLGIFSWQWEANPVGTDFTPHTVIHETGHALGLPDYYDYDPSIGPAGGVGGLDMMDANWGDHNAFSKWLLDWVTPTIIGDSNNVHTLTLYPSSLYSDCVTIMPGQTLSDYFAEYFIVQNRSRVYNDFYIPTDGLLIWHVDAQLNDSGTDFRYDNSYTDHKLLRLMEADGLEEIETGDGLADAGDFYTSGDVFSPYPEAIPNSTDYAGNYTGVSVLNITKNDLTMTADLIIYGGPDLTITSITSTPEIPSPGQPVSVTVNFANQGSDAGAFWIDLYKDHDTIPSSGEGGDDWVQISGLSAGQTSSTTFTYTYDTEGIKKVWAQIDTEGEVAEANENNNIFGPYNLSVSNPPFLNHTPVTFATKGEPISISVEINDDSPGTPSATLYYRKGGRGSYAFLSMSLTSGSNYTATIPASEVTDRAIEYYIEAQDIYGGTATSPII